MINKIFAVALLISCAAFINGYLQGDGNATAILAATLSGGAAVRFIIREENKLCANCHAEEHDKD